MKTFFKHVYMLKYMIMPCSYLDKQHVNLMTLEWTCMFSIVSCVTKRCKPGESKVHHQPTSTLLEDIAAYFYLMATLLGCFYRL